MRTALFAFVLVGVFLYAQTTGAEMTSSNYQIRWDSITTGGSDTSSSASYTLRDSMGNLVPGSSTSTNYGLSDGYRAGVFDQILTFDLFSQASNNPASVTSLSGTTIATATTTGISAGDYIVLMQDIGSSQVSAVGKVTSVASGVSITVDGWSTNGTMPTIDGVNDKYSKLSGTSLGFAELSPGEVSTMVLGMEVNADTPNGYTVQVMADGDLTNGTVSIPGVADGAVTVGSLEYGASSSDTSLASSTFDTQDSAFTTAFQDIVTQSGFKYIDRHFLTLKASRGESLASGTYSQVLTIIASGNF